MNKLIFPLLMIMVNIYSVFAMIGAVVNETSIIPAFLTYVISLITLFMESRIK